MTFGQRLRMLRTEKKMTQEDLGKLLNVTKVSVSGYENETRSPDKESLVKLADFFNVSTDYLLGNTDNKLPLYSDGPKLNEKQSLIAAHIDDDVSDDEMKEILSFIDYVKNRDKK